MYWIFQLFMYGLMQVGGPLLISIVFAILWWCIALLWIKQANVKVAPFYGSIFFLAFVLGIQMRFEPRPEVFSYLFLSLLIAIVVNLDLTQKPSWRALAALFALESLWTGFHGYFALGPCVAVALMASVLWEGKWRLNTRAAYVFSAVTLGSFASPFGFKVWEGVWRYAEVSRALRDINHELMPTPMLTLYWPLTLFWVYWLLAFGYSVVLLYRRLQTFPAFLALGGILLSIQATRNVPLFFIMVAPLTGVALRTLARFEPVRRVWTYAPSAIALVLSVFVVRGDYHKWSSSLGTFGFGLEKSAYPIGVADFLRGLQLKGKIFSDSYDGGYLEYHLPSAKVAGDSYFADGNLTLKYFGAIRDPLAFRDLDEEFRFDALVINLENQEVLASIWGNPEWKLAFADSHRTVFLRASEMRAREFDLLRARLYDGEDLTHWTYAFGVTTWAQMAAKMRNVPLMKKVLREVNQAPAVPRAILDAAAYLNRETEDAELLQLARDLEPRAR